jgi:hypothetical protein
MAETVMVPPTEIQNEPQNWTIPNYSTPVKSAGGKEPSVVKPELPNGAGAQGA